MTIINAKIFTMCSDVIENGYVSYENGKITAVGTMEQFSGQGEIIDLKGACLYPGFIDAHTHLGMWEDSLGFEGDDGNEETDPSTPHMRALDSVNPMDKCFREALDSGITTILTCPGSANSIGGQGVLLKTYGSRTDDMIIAAPAMMKFAMGENPKSIYHSKSQSPVTRMANVAIIRETLSKAKRYMEDLEAAQNDEDLDKPEFDAKCEALIPLLKGEIKAHFHAHRCDDIFSAIRIAREFNLKYCIIHATGSYKMAETMKQEQCELLLGPQICDRAKPELHDLELKSAGILERAGVKTTIITDHPVTPIQYLTVAAALCIREGLSFDGALKAITINPAEILGIDNRVGSIRQGLDADFVAFDGSPFDILQKPQLVVIDGRVHLNKTEQEK